jgi:murein DD-endopeptidase MepM/ murein hydrolase activator NlpD
LPRRHYTILIVPNDQSKVRRVRLPEPLLALVAAAAAFGAALFIAGLYTSLIDHVHLVKERQARVQLEAQNRTQEGHIQLFAARIQDLESRLGEMQALGRKLRSMANLNDQREVVAPSPRFSVGGSSLDEDRWAFGLYELQDTITDELQSELDRLSLEAALQEQSLKELNRSFMEKSLRDAHTPAIWPSIGLVTSDFGQRINPITGRHQFHMGIDIAARRGTPVYATADGVVVFAGRSGGLGRLVMISHGNGLKTRYGHLSETYVAPGQQVTRGTKIGAIGTTGRSTGPHLHYEVVKNGASVDPRKFITN